jgi:hypothetical protein
MKARRAKDDGRLALVAAVGKYLAAHEPDKASHPALFEREDCTLMAWYRCFYAPRAGGAHDSHHRTSGIAGHTRRRRYVAARGARSAGFTLMSMGLRCSAVSRAYFLLCVAAATANKHRHWYSMARSQITSDRSGLA